MQTVSQIISDIEVFNPCLEAKVYDRKSKSYQPAECRVGRDHTTLEDDVYLWNGRDTYGNSAFRTIGEIVECARKFLWQDSFPVHVLKAALKHDSNGMAFVSLRRVRNRI